MSLTREGLPVLATDLDGTFAAGTPAARAQLQAEPDDMEGALDEALSLEPGERTARMLKLRDRVLSWDVHRWAHTLLRDAERAGFASRMTG